MSVSFIRTGSGERGLRVEGEPFLAKVQGNGRANGKMLPKIGDILFPEFQVNDP